MYFFNNGTSLNDDNNNETILDEKSANKNHLGLIIGSLLSTILSIIPLFIPLIIISIISAIIILIKQKQKRLSLGTISFFISIFPTFLATIFLLLYIVLETLGLSNEYFLIAVQKGAVLGFYSVIFGIVAIILGIVALLKRDKNRLFAILAIIFSFYTPMISLMSAVTFGR